MARKVACGKDVVVDLLRPREKAAPTKGLQLVPAAEGDCGSVGKVGGGEGHEHLVGGLGGTRIIEPLKQLGRRVGFVEGKAFVLRCGIFETVEATRSVWDAPAATAAGRERAATVVGGFTADFLFVGVVPKRFGVERGAAGDGLL